MWMHEELSDSQLKFFIKNSLITLGGNKKLKIFGLLSCASGKRMKKANRVFFESEKEAKKHGYRPCGHCMKREYEKFRAII
jgi:methylphosphotriester-DNA--protein-cysteine methyltransferase